MEYTYKMWKSSDIYNFDIEFNRIESYNKYCKDWLYSYYGTTLPIQIKNDWTMEDIIDLTNYNNLKSNVNACVSRINSIYNVETTKILTIIDTYNQSFDYYKANEIEEMLKDYLSKLGSLQFLYNVSGLTTSGNNLKLNGVM